MLYLLLTYYEKMQVRMSEISKTRRRTSVKILPAVTSQRTFQKFMLIGTHADKSKKRTNLIA